MNKKLYTLFALGTLLFAACSDNASISGSTSVPNMVNPNNVIVPRSIVLCSQRVVSADSSQNCWDGEMWNTTSGYRVYTGFDNGSNTSGIWTWNIVPASNNVEIAFEWPGAATAEYDSMALADVIDKCGGSLCGKVVAKHVSNGSESNTQTSQAYVEFYFAGKDSLGHVQSANLSDLNGLCIEYSGTFARFELVADDSITPLLNGGYMHFMLSGNIVPDNGGVVHTVAPKPVEQCFSWSDVYYEPYCDYTQGLSLSEACSNTDVRREDVISHLKGLRFVIESRHDTEADLEYDFNILSIGLYEKISTPPTGTLPVNENCEVASVKESFCDCDFSEEIVDLELRSKRGFHFSKLHDGSESYSPQVIECIDSTQKSLQNGNLTARYNLDTYRLSMNPCDNPRPKILACADGSESESVEYSQLKAEFDATVNAGLERQNAVEDSLFAQCLSL